MLRTYEELVSIHTFRERFEYLKLSGYVGAETFGFDRFINQRFYTSQEWKRTRDLIIVRDLGCDLAFPDHEIFGKIFIHHMNPISAKDIDRVTDILMSPEFLVCTSHITHNAIHYGDASLLPSEPIERTKNDTCPWKTVTK